jgi:CheY-like chemotaxis protein
MSQLRIVAARRKRPSTVPPKKVTDAAMMRDASLSPLILLVDDSDDTRAFYAEHLSAFGFRVDHCVDGEQGFVRAMSHRPDLVVMDLEMPILDGWEATRRIKSHPKTKHIPVLAITGHALQEHLRRAHDAGADAVLIKPCQLVVLLGTIRELLARSGKSSS